MTALAPLTRRHPLDSASRLAHISFGSLGYGLKLRGRTTRAQPDRIIDWPTLAL